MLTNVQRSKQGASKHGDAPPDQAEAQSPTCPLRALCVIARLHHIAAEPHSLRHKLGLGATAEVGEHDLLLAAQRIGLKAKVSRIVIGLLVIILFETVLTVLRTYVVKFKIVPVRFQQPPRIA